MWSISLALTAFVGGGDVGMPLVAPPAMRREYVSKQVGFVGFSADESTAAWRVRVRRSSQRGITDNYVLIKVSDTATNDVLAVFRGSGIHREDARGHRLRVKRSALLASNPEYAEAESRRSWLVLRMGAGFTAKELEATELGVTVVPDDGIDVETWTEDGSLMVRARTPGSLGFRLVASVGNRTVAIGQFYERGDDRTRFRARLSVYRSTSSGRLAILNRFDVVSGPTTPPVYVGAVVKTPGARDRAYYRAQLLGVAEQLHQEANFFGQ